MHNVYSNIPEIVEETIVASYARVSTDHEEQLSSIENQRNHYKAYCIKNDYKLYRLYADEGLSATSANRKEFLEMLYDAGLDFTHEKKNSKKITFKKSDREPKFNLIITKDVSRFARNTNATDILRLLVESGVHVIFENANLSTRSKNWEFEIGLYLLLSQQESVDKSHKVKFAYKQRATDGKFHMSVPLYGYSYDKITKKTSIVKDEALIVKLIFDLYINQNKGFKAIANMLNENKVPARKAELWRSTTIRGMILNEKYTGTAIVNKLTKTDITSSHKVIKKNEEEWITIKGALPQIIDEEQWQEAQETMKKRVVVTDGGTKRGNRATEDKFSNKIVCGKCGSTYTRVSGTKIRKAGKVKEFTYYCRQRRVFKNCDMRGVSFKILERKINELVNEKLSSLLHMNYNTEKAHAEQYLAQLDTKQGAIDSEIQKLKAEADEKQEQIDKLINGFIKNSNSSVAVIAAIESKIESITYEKEAIEKQMLNFSTEAFDHKRMLIYKRLEQIKGITNKKVYTFDEALDLIDSIVVQEGKKLTIKIKSPSIIPFTLSEANSEPSEQFLIVRYQTEY